MLGERASLLCVVRSLEITESLCEAERKAFLVGVLPEGADNGHGIVEIVFRVRKDAPHDADVGTVGKRQPQCKANMPPC